jgi:MPBQ/MSBQ methyltransferase
MRALYADSGYFNVGYWAEGPADLVQACNRLTDRLAASVPGDARLIVDVGCGLGAGTCRLQDRFPEAIVIGANISPWQLERARSRGVKSPVAMDAARLAIASGAADAVLAMESALNFDTRADFLAEACRVLRPGGTIALADMLFNDREPVGPWLLPAANEVDGLKGYAEALFQVGFGEIEVHDATDSCWRPYCTLLRRTFPDWPRAKLEALEQSVSHYLLACARKL